MRVLRRRLEKALITAVIAVMTTSQAAPGVIGDTGTRLESAALVVQPSYPSLLRLASIPQSYLGAKEHYAVSKQLGQSIPAAWARNRRSHRLQGDRRENPG